MASPPPPPPAAPSFALLLLLLSIALVAAQPPRTNVSDADALYAVFRHWGLEVGSQRPPPGYNPCGKLIWFNTSDKNASIDCNCSGQECRITHLNVTGYWNITGSIPEDLYNLTELVSLDLSNNNLTDSINPNVANLTKLEIWHFNNNQLSGRFPHEYLGLMNLKSLWMFDNDIEGPVPEYIANFTNLTDLRIYGMKLQGSIPEKFSNLINLENLILGDLNGANSSFDFMENLPNLSTLSLRKCGITGKLPSSLLSLSNRKLKYLDLRSNYISGPIPPSSSLLSSDTIDIYVGDNNLTGPLNITLRKHALDVSNNTLLNVNLDIGPAGLQHINYIGTSINATEASESEINLLNCIHNRGCGKNELTSTNHVPFAVNCGGEKYIYPLNSSQIVFNDDSTVLGKAGFHVNASSGLVVSHVGADPFSNSTGIVNTNNTNGADMPELYRTARTSTGALWYYVIGLPSGSYTVQLFFAEIVIEESEPGRRLFNIDIQDESVRTDFDIYKEAGGSHKPINITYGAYVNNSVLKIHFYWNGRGTCCIPSEGSYGPLVSAIKVFRPDDEKTSPPPAPHRTRQDEKRRGVVAGIAALCIAAAVISSSVVYLWWKWVSLVKHPKA